VKNLRKSEHIFSKIIVTETMFDYINEVQVRSGNCTGGCLACPQVFFENESRKNATFVITTSLNVSSVK
jgi:hypothetical protein